MSKPFAVKVFGDEECRFVLEDYEEEEDKEAFQQAIANFLAIDDIVLKQAQNDIYQYYKDVEAMLEEDDIIKIDNPNDVWQHIEFGSTPIVLRRSYGDKAIYISLECEYDWEPEHGLQIVFKNGFSVSKVGAYDGHVSNADI